jgi:Mn2+/Fe2+ NRAMP family transporter
VLIPILYSVQEITIRLGVVTGKGHGALIRERFGAKWAMVSSATLLVSAVGALLTEFAGVAGVGELFGISKWVTIPIATTFLVALAFGESYKRVERIGIAIGLAELAFVGAMVLAHPGGHDLFHGLSAQPFHNPSYLKLLAANIGAVVMPWMIFYQQGAVIDRGLPVAGLRAERRDTLFGSFLTQGIMIVVIIALAATAYKTDRGAALNTVPQIAGLLGRTIGTETGKILVGVSILGGALVAALVVSLAGAWGMSEVLGWKHTLNERPSHQNAKFYVTYALAHIVGAVVVLASIDVVGLAVDVEVINALLLPIVLGFLLLLEAKALPEEHRMRGAYRWTVTIACLVVMVFGLYMVPASVHL